MRGIFKHKTFTISLPGIILFGITLLQGYTSFFTEEANGARRWITLGSVSVQTSELAKFAVIIFGAYICSKNPKKINTVKGFLAAIVFVAPLLFFIGIENLSAAIIVAAIYGTIIFVNAKKAARYILLAFISGFIAKEVTKLMGGYRSARIAIMENVETNEKGQQILQGLYAIASGGFFGKGLGGSEQKYGRVPEAYNDMIFTIICEEFGIFGGIAIILLFVLIIARMIVVIINAKDRFGALLGLGIMSQIAIQAILNILVVTNKIPSTGVILPFISFGGTAITIMLFEIGFFLNISMQIEYKHRLLIKKSVKNSNGREN